MALSQPVLFVPEFWFPPSVCRALPGFRSVLDGLSVNYEVRVFTWPFLESDDASATELETSLEHLRSQLPSGGHLLTMRRASVVALLALDEAKPGVRCLVAAGLGMNPAVLQTLGQSALAEATSHRVEAEGRHFYGDFDLRRYMRGADEETIRDTADLIAREVNWDQVEQFMAGYEAINLLRARPRVIIPALYLDLPLSVTVFTDMEPGQLFHRLVPHAELDRLVSWPRLDDPQSGAELAGRARTFFEQVGGEAVLTTVLFTDIVDSTARAAELGDRAWKELLTLHQNEVRKELARYSGTEVDTAGDGFLATFESPAKALRCGLAVIEGARRQGIETRAGVHTGECQVIGDKVTGLAVHIGARVAALAGPSELLISSTVHDLLEGSGLTFKDRGRHQLKGTAGERQLFAVSAAR